MATRLIDRAKLEEIFTYQLRDYETQFRLIALPDMENPDHVRIRNIPDAGHENLQDKGIRYEVSEFNKNFRKTPGDDDKLSQKFIVAMFQARSFGFLNEAQALLIEADI